MTGAAEQQPSPSEKASFGQNLPRRPERYVPTSIVEQVQIRVKVGVLTGRFCLIDGPVGVGKTTAVIEAARLLSTDAVYVNMFGADTTRSAMQAIWHAMTGTAGAGTALDIRRDILAYLMSTNTTILIDDGDCPRFG